MFRKHSENAFLGTGDTSAFVHETGALHSDTDKLPVVVRQTQTLARHQGIPRLPRICIRRKNIFGALESLNDVTIVQSLSGRGKSISAAEWAFHRRNQGDRVIWIDVPVEDTVEPTILRIADVLVNERSLEATQNRTIIVFDDAHNLIPGDSTEILLEAIRLVPNCHLVLVTSNELELEMVALAKRLTVRRVSGYELLLSLQEIQELAEAWELPISKGRAVELLELTGGWMWVIKLILKGSVADYGSIAGGTEWTLAKQEILSSIRVPELLEIAESMAILDNIDLESVTALKQTASVMVTPWNSIEPGEAIFALQRFGQILTMPNENRLTWAFPTFVRNCLRSDLEKRHPGISMTIHGDLAEHFEGMSRADMLDRILVHARSGQRWDILARMYATYGAWGCYRFPREARFAYESVPLEIQRMFPALTLSRSTVNDDRSEKLQLRFGVVDGSTTYENLTQNVVREVVPSLAALNATVIVEELQDHGKLNQALDFVQWAQEHLDVSKRTELTELNISTLYFQHGRLLMLLGQPDESLNVTRTAFDSAGSIASKRLRCQAAGQMALLYAAKNQYALAQNWCTVANELSATLYPQEIAALQPLRLAQAVLALDALDYETAAQRLAEAKYHRVDSALDYAISLAESELSLVSGRSSEHLMRSPQCETPLEQVSSPVILCPLTDSYLSLLTAEGHLNRVARQLAGFPASSVQFVAHKSYLLLLNGEFEKAWALAGKLRIDRFTPRNQVQIQLTIAVAALEVGDLAAAINAATNAHRIAELSQSYFALAKFKPDTLQHLADLAGISWRVKNIAHIGVAYPQKAQLVRLSERESVVLRSLREFDTLPSVAKDLFVSVNTVKKQIHSVYRKLGVNSKQAALTRGVELGLLDS